MKLTHHENAPPVAWLLHLVATYTLPWVQAALRRAEAQHARGRPILAGYVVRTLQGFARDGGVARTTCRSRPTIRL
jgi:hypothetical protein